MCTPKSKYKTAVPWRSIGTIPSGDFFCALIISRLYFAERQNGQTGKPLQTRRKIFSSGQVFQKPNLNRWFSIETYLFCRGRVDFFEFFLKFFCKKVCIYEKKVVPLQRKWIITTDNTHEKGTISFPDCCVFVSNILC